MGAGSGLPGGEFIAALSENPNIPGMFSPGQTFFMPSQIIISNSLFES
jgi:hypothetical protein